MNSYLTVLWLSVDQNNCRSSLKALLLKFVMSQYLVCCEIIVKTAVYMGIIFCSMKDVCALNVMYL